MKSMYSRFYICIAAVLWGGISLLVRPLSDIGYSSLQIVFLRVFIATAGMAMYMAVFDRSLFTIRLRDSWLFIGSGVFSLALFNFCYFRAMEILSVSISATLLYTAPVFVMLISAFVFHEKITARKLIAVVCTGIGCMLVTGVFETETAIQWKGILFGLGSGIGYALYSIFGTLALRRYRTQTVTFYTFLVASLSVLPFCHPRDIVTHFQQQPAQTLVFAVGIGVVVCLLPYWLYTKGLECIRPSEASVIATLEPVVAALIGCAVFSETLSIFTIIGIVAILVSIGIINLFE